MALTQVSSGLISSVANTAITGNIISSQITSVANTQVTGLMTASQVASVANTQITGLMTASQIATVANTQITGTITSSQLSNTAVGAGSYGSASAVPSISINAQGQITSATNTTIALGASAITSGTLPIARGGTNATCTPTSGGVAYGTGSAIGYTAAGTSGYYLKSNGTGAPSWAAVCAAPPTAYGAVGTYVIAAATENVGAWFRPGCTAAGACLIRASDTGCSITLYGGSMNIRKCLNALSGYIYSGTSASIGVSGTWRSMTNSYQAYLYMRGYNLWVRVS
jgi:hypothetical protein